jgi:SAM-dependent methyltransferase
MTEDLGLSESVAAERSAAETKGASGCVCDEFEAIGVTLRGMCVLDLGAGLGGLSEQMVRRGARVVGIEPGAAWRRLASRRVAAWPECAIIGAVGEALPLADNSIDVVMSLQVLEHVQHPAQVIREVFRVLKPGGYALINYENYLSFWEPHYRVRWFPLLPKPVGALYLRALGRNPAFLLEAVTYTTFPAVRNNFLSTGFECVRMRSFRDSLRSGSKNSLPWRTLKAIAAIHEPSAHRLIVGLDFLRRCFRTRVGEFMQKPLNVAGHATGPESMK